MAILYVLAGTLLAIPYCLLAGWDAKSFPMVAFVAPAFLFVWFILATFAGIIDVRDGKPRFHLNWRAAFYKGERRRLPGSHVIFWIWSLYSLLPIILHWSAALLNSVGFTAVASALETHRYASPYFLFLGTWVLLVIVGMALGAWETVRGRWTRLANR